MWARHLSVAEARVTPAVDGMIEIEKVVGHINVPEDERVAHIARNIRLGLPQVFPYAAQSTRIAIVGGGPSLSTSVDDLRRQAWAGHRIVATNGSYQWLLDRNIKPTSMVMIDGRPDNLRFLEAGPVPECSLFLASQCHPSVFDRAIAQGWSNLFIFHAIGQDPTLDTKERQALDAYYLKAWAPVAGGSTVVLRAIPLFSMLGFRSFDLYGCDSCVHGAQHHAFAQPENDPDEVQLTRTSDGRPFHCAAWHISQALELIDMIKTNGDAFRLHIHGDGLLAHLLRLGADSQAAFAASQKE
jgi:hypothetical protein